MPLDFSQQGTPIEAPDFSSGGTPVEAPDFSGGGTPVDQLDAHQAMLYPAQPPGLVERLRRELSPLLGPTEDQQQQDGVDLAQPDGATKRVYQPLGSAADREGFFPALSKPAVAIPRFQAQPGDGKATAIGKAVANTAAGFGEFLESPLGVASAGIAGAAPNAARAVSAAYAADMASKLPAAATAAGTASVTGNTQQKAEAMLGLAAQVVLPATLAAHAAIGGAAMPASRTVEGVSEFGGDNKTATPPPVPESPETLQAQVDATKDPNSSKAVTLVTPGAEIPADHGLTAVDTDQGTALVNPAKVDPDEAKDLFDQGGGGMLLGMSTDTKPTGSDAVLQTKDAQGRVAQDEVVTPGTVAPAQAAAAAAVPGGSSELKPAQQVLAERQSTSTGVAGAPVQRVAASAIAARPDLMQFKRMDDTTTGVNAGDKLNGKWDDLKGGNLLLWEPKDPNAHGLAPGEKYIVANGHHRFEFGERAGVPQFNAQIVRERDGYSAQDARALAAEINIADGKGTIYDQVKFLRNEGATHGPDAALARAGRTGAQGRQAATIAFAAGPDLYDSFVNEQIKPEQAEAIAKSAPTGQDGSDGLQRLGVRKALDGASPGELQNLMQAVKLEGRNVPAQQFDLFAADDTAIKAAEQLANVAGRIQGELSREIRATDSAAKNASTAKAKGIQFDRPPAEILADNARLKVERDRWDNWALHPELVKQVRDYAEMQRSQGGKAPKTLDEKLQGLKIDTAGKLFEGVTSLPIHIWNASIDIIRGAVAGGKMLSQAVQDGIDWIKRQHPDVNFDEGDYKRAVARQFGERQFGTALKVDPDVSDATKQGVGEYVYQRRTNEDDSQAAQRIIQAHGLEDAAKLYTNDRVTMDGGLRSVLGKTLIKGFADAERAATASGDTAGADRLVRQQVDLIDHDLKRSTDVAQALQAMSVYGDMSPQGMLQHARRTFGDAGEKQMEAVKPVADLVSHGFADANREAVSQTVQDRDVNAAARRAVNDQVTNSDATRKGVIVEITGAMAESPEILRQAREQLGGGELNRILVKQGLPLGNRSKAELASIMDDFSKRAAGIAAAHYQGAELGKPLAKKFEERLGLTPAAAKRLAIGMDKTFASMVKKAQEKLPWRIANQRALQVKPWDPNEVNVPAVDRTIREQLRAANQKLGQLVQQHASVVDAAGRSIGERVVKDSGLTGPAADTLQRAFDSRFKELATAAKQAVVKKILAAGNKMTPRMRSAVSDLIRATNAGAFDDSKFYEALQKKLDLPTLTKSLANEIVRRANALQQLPEGFQRDRESVKLLNFIAQQKGLKISDLAPAFWYANTLSGITTPAHIMLDNLGEYAGNSLIAMIRNPGAAPRLAGALARGLGKGALHAREILNTGHVTGIKDQVHTATALELDPFTGWKSVLNNWKYVGRVISATHVAMFKPAMELKAEIVAREVARSRGLTGDALKQAVTDIMGNTETRVAAARAQATGEGLTGLDLRRRVGEIIEQQREQAAPGITDSARQFALRSTYLNDPYGFAGTLAQNMTQWFSAREQRMGELQQALEQRGWAARNIASPALGIARVAPRLGALPFARLAGNILDEKLNWTPVGAFRAFRGQLTKELYGKPITDTQAIGDLYTKAALGTLATSAVLSGMVTVTGSGPASPAAKKQLMETGWRPNSVKLGNMYVSYLRTPPALALAAIGNYQDAQRYRHLDDDSAMSRVSYALSGVSGAIMNQSYLDSLGELMEAAKNENPKSAAEKWQHVVARTGSRFVVPNAVTQIDRLFDPTVYDDKDIESLLRAQVPFARRENRPVINVLGDPIQRGIFDRDVTWAKPDELWQAIADKQSWVPEPSPSTIVGDRKRGPDHFRALTPDEMYDYTQASGQKIREALENKLGKLQDMEPDQAKKFVDSITSEIRRDTLKHYHP